MADTKKTIKKSTRSRVTKEKIEPIVVPQPEERSSFLPEFLRFGESYSSLVLGIVVVIAVAFLLVSFARSGNHNRNQQDTSSTNTKADQQETSPQPGNIYTVEEGDDLWKIAMSAYNDGTMWEKIATANDIANPGDLSVGTRLRIPELETDTQLSVNVSPTSMATATPTLPVTPTVMATATVTTQPTLTPTSQPTTVAKATTTPIPTIIASAPSNGPNTAVAGKTYTVVSGDTLWDIAEQAYGDGSRWVDIAQANNWAQPDLIYPGNTFTLPAK